MRFHEPHDMGDGRQTIEDAEWGRWHILVDADGTCSVKDYHEDVDDWIAHDLPNVEAAKAHVDALYRAELAEVGL